MEPLLEHQSQTRNTPYGCVGSLQGWRMWLRRPSVVDSKELTAAQREQIYEAVQEDVAELLAARDGELEDLCERIDFAERLLIRARAPEDVLEREATPV